MLRYQQATLVRSLLCVRPLRLTDALLRSPNGSSDGNTQQLRRVYLPRTVRRLSLQKWTRI